MATVTFAGDTFTTTAGSKTLTATPAVGDLIVVFVAATGVVTSTSYGVSDNNTDGHGTYLRITTALKATSADGLAAFVRADPIQRAVSTIWTTSGDTASTGGGLAVWRINGLTLTALQAVRQSAVQSNQAAAGTPAPVLGAAALTGNPLVGAIFNATNPATMTPPTSWTEDADVGYATPTTGLEAVHIASGFTGSTVTWGGTSGSAFCSMVVELSTAAGQTSIFPARGSGALDITLSDSPKLVAVKRAANY
jgi:hypothetical protein